MIRPNTWGVVTLVANMEPIRNPAVCENPGNAMSVLLNDICSGA